MNTTFDKAHFLAKFSQLSDADVGIGSSGRCVLWHCGARWDGTPAPEEATALYTLLGAYPEGYQLYQRSSVGKGKPKLVSVGIRQELYRAPSINDGDDPAYQQATPRLRILAALSDLP